MSRLLRGLPAQLVLTTILPLALVLIVVSLGSVALHQQAMRAMVSERDLRAAIATAKVLGSTLQRKQNTLVALAGHLSPMFASRTSDVTLGTIAFSTQEFPEGLAVFAQDGRLITHTSSAASWSMAPTTSRALANLIPVAPLAPIVDGEALFLITPISGHRALLASRVPIAALALSDMVEHDSSGGKVMALLFDSTSRVLYRTTNALPIDNLSGHAGVAEALQGRQGVVYTSDATTDGEHVVSYVPITTPEGLTGLGLIIEEPWREVANPLLQFSLALPLITLPVLLLALLAIVFGIRRIVEPLHTLQKRARLAGNGNFSVLSEPVHGIEEIEELQDTLNKMATQIQADQERLRRYAHAVTEAQEAERKRLARELHDDTIQNLIVLSQRMQMLRGKLNRELPELASKADDLRGMIVQMIEDVRRFSRALRPIYLEEAGLAPALERLVCDAGEITRQNGHSEIIVHFESNGLVARLSPAAELALYRVAQEALANALRHANANRVVIRLDGLADDSTQLSISDDGCGLPNTYDMVNGVSIQFDRTSGGFGLMDIHERATLVGASVEIDSQIGRGTTVRVTLPTAVSPHVNSIAAGH